MDKFSTLQVFCGAVPRARARRTNALGGGAHFGTQPQFVRIFHCV